MGLFDIFKKDTVKSDNRDNNQDKKKNYNVKTELESIKNTLAKPAVIFETGGKRPTKELMESWIGRIGWKSSDEDIPEDNNGEPMVPVMTLFVKDLPYVPKAIKHIELITVFISITAIEECLLEEEDFCVRTYDSLEALESCDWQTDYIKAFPLTSKVVEEDYPAWDSEDISESIRDRILELENTGEIDYFEDIANNEDKCFHKIGGYPSYIQSGITWENYEFIFQIASDDKANFYFGDGGNIYFFYNKDEDLWGAHYDYY